jgi:hypothetical protein
MTSARRLQLVRSFRIPALLCALSVLLCELIARPYTSISVCDDGPFILMARTLASTGHIVYNGWSAAMLIWQLYLGAAFIKLFGYSFTAVRSSTVFIASLTAFVLQRTLVRTGITERNATIGTLAFVLSPLYLLISVTFMSDIFGLFAIVVCLYGCLRALQAATDRSAILWLCFAVTTNVLCGTSRQIAWLGAVVIVPSTLWLLRAQRNGLPAQRRVAIAGAAITLSGALFILVCMDWLKHQPYIVHVALFVPDFPLVVLAFQLMISLLLEIPFLLLPLAALFLPQIRKSRPAVIGLVCACLLAYLVLSFHPRHGIFLFRLEPTYGDWVTAQGFFHSTFLRGTPPIFLNVATQTLLTIVSLGGLSGFIVALLRPVLLRSSLLRPQQERPAPNLSTTGVSWKQLAFLLVPFSFAYMLLLLSVFATTGYLVDRYLVGLMLVAVIGLIRYFQEQIQPQLPLAAFVLIAVFSIYGVTLTHNMFAFYRARAALAAELTASGVPDTSVDGGWEENFDVELEYSNHLNNPLIPVPAHAYVRSPEPPPGHCYAFWYDYTPHIHPIYAIAFDPMGCDGPAPFAPVHYSRWLNSTPGTLYVVRYTSPPKP